MGTASILSPLDVRLEDCQLSEASRWDPQRRANVRCPPRRSSPWGAGKSRPRTWCGSCSWRRRSTGSRRRGRTCRACTGGAPFISRCHCGRSRSCPNSGDLPSVRSVSSRVLGWGGGGAGGRIHRSPVSRGFREAGARSAGLVLSQRGALGMCTRCAGRAHHG